MATTIISQRRWNSRQAYSILECGHRILFKCCRYKLSGKKYLFSNRYCQDIPLIIPRPCINYLKFTVGLGFTMIWSFHQSAIQDSLYPRYPKGEGVYCFTSVRLSVLPSVQDIFRRIFLSNCWWQKSDVWSQASYRYPILWEAFFDPSDSYFLFAEERGYHRWASCFYRLSSLLHSGMAFNWLNIKSIVL